MSMIKPLIVAPLAALVLTACVAKTSDNVAILEGPPAQSLETYYDRALVCLREQMTAQSIEPAFVAIGQIADRTGRSKYNENETVNVTEGAGDMVSSAVQTNGLAYLVERLDTRVMLFEQQMAMKKILGDGKSTKVASSDGQARTVDYRAIEFGSLQGSSHFIVGSISAIDWAVSSAGATVEIAGIGPRARQGRGLVSLDLRVVNTQTGRVVSATTVKRQVVSNEAGVGAFRFWGSTLLNIDVGAQQNTPLNHILRGALHLGIYRMMSDVYKVDVKSCDAELAGSESMETS